jgi:hypothetical protein
MTYTKSSDVITVNVPGVTDVKRRPAVVLSSNKYHNIRPDVIVGLITSQTKRVGTTDYVLQDWQAAVVGWVKRRGTQHKTEQSEAAEPPEDGGLIKSSYPWGLPSVLAENQLLAAAGLYCKNMAT